MRLFFRAVIALCTLCSIFLVGFYLGMIRIPMLEKGLSEYEAECIVAAIHSDARAAGDVSLAVRREVGLAVIRHARKYRLDVCDVVIGGRTLVPQGYQRPGLCVGRDIRYIKRVEATSASWLSDLELVPQLLKESGAGCITHYLRAPRWTDMCAQPSDVAARFRSAGFVSQGRAKEKGVEVGKAEFFCSP